MVVVAWEAVLVFVVVVVAVAAAGCVVVVVTSTSVESVTGCVVSGFWGAGFFLRCFNSICCNSYVLIFRIFNITIGLKY